MLVKCEKMQMEGLGRVIDGSKKTKDKKPVVDNGYYWLYTGRGPLTLPNLKNFIFGRSIIFRLENYSLAAHIFLKNPLFGIGLHSPFKDHIKDYSLKITNDRMYYNFIKEKKTLENIILCGFVEMGGLFAVTYIGFIIYLLRNLFLVTRNKPEKRLRAILLLIPLAGFFVHSMTFDSLIYPHLNWLFHSYLGLMANFDKI